jgi:competence protein ComEA
MSARWVLLCLCLALQVPVHAEATLTPATEVSAPVVNLNVASVEELCTLPGIGRKKAEAIVALRTRRPLTRVTQLLQVKGIGPKTLHRLKPRLSVAPAPPAPTVKPDA